MRLPAVDPMQRPHVAVEHAPDGLAITDANGSLIYANKAMAGMHGFPPAAHVSEALAAMAPPDQLRLFKAAYGLLVAPGEFEREIRCEQRGGTHFKARLRRLRLQNERGNLIGLIFVFQNPQSARPVKKGGKRRPAGSGSTPAGHPEQLPSEFRPVRNKPV